MHGHAHIVNETYSPGWSYMSPSSALKEFKLSVTSRLHAPHFLPEWRNWRYLKTLPLNGADRINGHFKIVLRDGLGLASL